MHGAHPAMVLEQQGSPAQERQPTEDRRLAERVQGGDKAAFGQLVERYMRRAHRVAVSLVGSHEDARDLSQEAFVRAYRARRRLDPARPFYPWYYQILRRLCFNFLRDRATRRQKLEQAAPWLIENAAYRHSAGRPDRVAERAALLRRLQAGIEGLSEHQREVFVLRELHGLRYAEIAELAEIPIGTVMSRLYAARRRLATRLEDTR